MSTRVIAEHPLTEIVEMRDSNTRVWERVKEVEMTYPDGRKERDTVRSRVLEKGSGICYRDSDGEFVPAVAEWEVTISAFAVERCVYRLYAGPTLTTPLSYDVEGIELQFRPAALVARDGEREAVLASVNPNAMGRIDENDRSHLTFAGAFGPGFDLEYVLEPAAIHQDLIIREPILLPEDFDPDTATVSVLTELDLDDYTEQGIGILVGETNVDLAAEEFGTSACLHEPIRFMRPDAHGEVVLHCFLQSPVQDDSGRIFFAERRIYRDPDAQKTYLEETISYSPLSDCVLPVVWDWMSGQNVPSGETEEWGPKETVYVSSDVSIYGTLIIRPGTTVKIASGRKIEVQSGGCLRAVGDPYNFITITSSNDDQSGEDLTPGTTSGQAGDYAYAFRLMQGSSGSSAIQHSKVGYAETGIEDNVSLVTEIRDNVIRDIESYGIYLNSVTTNCRNNLLVECGEDGIRCVGCNSSEIANNTADSCGDGIHTSSSQGLVVKRNLLTRNSVGIRSYNDSDNQYDYNGFWRNTNNFVGVGQQGANNVQLGWDDNPYQASTLGDFFLDTGGDGWALSAGGEQATNARLTAEWYSVQAPVYKNGIKQDPGNETWSKKTTYGPDSVVYIGYHHSRVDFDANYIFIGGTLTINPGVVVCLSDWGLLAVGVDGDLQCVGNPDNGGYILFCGGRAASMRIESHAWPPPSAAGQNTLSSPHDPAYSRIKFTRFQWLYGGINVWQSLGANNALEHNVFSLCYWGVDVYAQINLDAKSDLFAMNDMGMRLRGWTSRATRTVYNCTFDDNDCGLRFNDYDHLTFKDSLFTNNDYGASQYHNYGGGTIQYDYNGFYNNAHNLYNEQTQQDIALGANDKDLEASPYDPHGGYAEPFYLIQHNNELIDGGSRSATAAGLSTYTTSLGSREDVGTSYVDIGYHYPLRLKPYLQNVKTNEITVMWHGTRNATGYVEWGPTEDYGNLLSRNPVRLGTSGIWIYEKPLPGLQANTLYHYRVKHGSSYSPDSTFYTAMSSGNSFRFLAYGDNRGGGETPANFQTDHLNVINAMLSHAWVDGQPAPRFVLHCGDFVYNGGTVGQWQPYFFNPAAGLLRNTPLWPSIGNHEYGDGASNYRLLFCVPSAGESWYSFDYANCHFIVLDTKDNAQADYIGPSSAQYQWLLSELSYGNGTQFDWVIVLLHIPPYTDSPAHPYGAAYPPEAQNDVYRVRTYLAPLFEDAAHPADLVISGHNHFYERSQARESAQSSHWVHYIVTGGAVRDVDLHTPGSGNPQRVNFPPYPGKAVEARHFCTIDISGTTATLNVIKEDGTKFEDGVVLHPGEHWVGP